MVAWLIRRDIKLAQKTRYWSSAHVTPSMIKLRNCEKTPGHRETWIKMFLINIIICSPVKINQTQITTYCQHLWADWGRSVMRLVAFPSKCHLRINLWSLTFTITPKNCFVCKDGTGEGGSEWKDFHSFTRVARQRTIVCKASSPYWPGKTCNKVWSFRHSG